jgi:Sec-independent protein translocase protein TatA
MDHNEHPPHRLLFVGLGAVVALIAVIALIAFLLFGLAKREDTSGSATQTAKTFATKQQVSSSISDVDMSLKQAQADQAAAKSALNEDKNRLKVGN